MLYTAHTQKGCVWSSFYLYLQVRVKPVITVLLHSATFSFFLSFAVQTEVQVRNRFVLMDWKLQLWLPHQHDAAAVMTKISFLSSKNSKSQRFHVHVRFRETDSRLHLQQGAMRSCSWSSRKDNCDTFLTATATITRTKTTEHITPAPS